MSVFDWEIVFSTLVGALFVATAIRAVTKTEKEKERERRALLRWLSWPVPFESFDVRHGVLVERGFSFLSLCHCVVFMTILVATYAIARVRFLLRWSIVACFFKSNQNKTSVLAYQLIPRRWRRPDMPQSLDIVFRNLAAATLAKLLLLALRILLCIHSGLHVVSSGHDSLLVRSSECLRWQSSMRDAT